MCIRKTACLVIVCFLLTSLGAFCQSKETPNQTSKALTALVKVKPGLKVEAKAIQALVDKILEDNTFLRDNFANQEYFAVADRLGERGTTLLTHKYEKKLGKDSARFWRDSWKKDASLDVVTVGIMVTDVLGIQKVKKIHGEPGSEDPTYDLVATVVQEFHVIEAAPATHNATSLGGSIYRHQDTCVWE
jgi:hypothetical protein